MWTLCVAVPILAAVVFLFVPLILLAIWASIADDPVSSAAIERFATAAILVATLAFLPIISTAILRLSLRLSPLAVGRQGRFHLVPILWLSWLLVFGLLAGSGAERITLIVAVVIGGCAMGRVYSFRERYP